MDSAKMKAALQCYTCIGKSKTKAKREKEKKRNDSPGKTAHAGPHHEKTAIQHI